MKITKCTYKDVPAVCLETENLICKILPENGCRLQSIVDKKSGREFMTLDMSEKFLPQFMGGNYVEGDVSGCDDMFPTIDPMKFEGGSRAGIEYPCHGEVCRVAHQTEISNDTFNSSYKSDLLNYEYKKTISESENGGIKTTYSIKNIGSDDFRCMWAAHFMIAAEKDGFAKTPYAYGAKGEIMFDEHNEFGKRGDVIEVDKNALTSKEYAKDANAYKFFFLDKMSKGECGYFVPSINRTITLKFDKNKLPYLGVWMNNGIFKGLYNVAMEIATSPFDKPETAIERGIDFKIAPNETFTFDFVVEID